MGLMDLFRRRGRDPKPPPVPTRPWPPASADRTTYTVRSGWAILAELVDGDLHWLALREGTSRTTDPAVPHSLYRPAAADVTADTTETHQPDPDADPLDSPRPAQLDDLLAALAEKDTVVDRTLRG
jgi:hypothetical protein